MALKYKKQQVRIIYGDGFALHRMDHAQANPNKVFAVIGPFEGHTDKTDLQDMLETLLRGYNTEPRL